ncbi:hypothetical protein JYU04_04045, partial [Dehalococcoides mccartyi]|nr:hypothetical protein [Dehalococcoides mccartyi]
MAVISHFFQPLRRMNIISSFRANKLIPTGTPIWSSLLNRSVLRTVAAVTVFYFIGMLLSFVSVQRSANSVFETEISSTLAGGQSGLDDLELKLDKLNYRIRRMKRWLFPVRQASKILFVVPPLERQRQAAELVLERVEADLDAAESALELGRSTLLIQEKTLGGSFSISRSENVTELRDSLNALQIDANAVLSDLDRSSEIEIRLNELGIGGPLQSLSNRFSVQ